MKTLLARVALTAALTLAALGRGQTLPATAPQADPRWQRLIERLGNPDFATRDAAQKDLDKTTWRDIEAIQALIQSTQDEEAKAWLASRLAAIQEQITVDPPPISIDAKDATLTQVAESLNKSLGTRLKIWPEGEEFRHGVTYTLAAADRPFWEVFCDLSKQHGLQFMSFGSDLQIQQTDPGWRSASIFGPLAVFPMAVSRSISFQEEGPKIPQPTMQLACTIALDPRIHATHYSQPRFLEILDESGNMLYQDKKPADSHLWDVPNGQGFFSVSAPLQILDKKSSRIASARGEAHFVVQMGQEQIEIPEVDKKVGQTFEIAGHKITMSKCDIRQNSFEIALSVQRSNSITPVPGGQNTQPPGVHVIIVDANGFKLLSETIRGGSSTSGSSTVVKPLKMVLSVPTKTKDLVIAFQLKDLLLP